MFLGLSVCLRVSLSLSIYIYICACGVSMYVGVLSHLLKLSVFRCVCLCFFDFICSRVALSFCANVRLNVSFETLTKRPQSQVTQP